MVNNAHLWAVGYDNICQAERVGAEIAKLGEAQRLILLDTAVTGRATMFSM